MSADPGTSTTDRGRASRVDWWVHEGAIIAERILMSGVAIALVILSFMALWNTIVLVRDEVRVHDLTRAIAVGVDTVFLTVILLELLHTVVSRVPLARQAPEFIVIGITSAIRHGLSLVATSSGAGQTINRVVGGKTYVISVPGTSNARDVVINLAINSAGVLLLVVALWIVRHSFQGVPEEGEI